MNKNKKQIKDLTIEEKLSVLYNDCFKYSLACGTFKDPQTVVVLQNLFRLLDDDIKKLKKK